MRHAGRVRLQQIALLPQGKTYFAYFSDAGGIKPGNSVLVSGYKVGKVNEVSLAGDTAKVTFDIDRKVVIGDQSLAAIRTDTILGERSISVSPAGAGQATTIPLSRTTTPYTSTARWRISVATPPTSTSRNSSRPYGS